MQVKAIPKKADPPKAEVVQEVDIPLFPDVEHTLHITLHDPEPAPTDPELVALEKRLLTLVLDKVQNFEQT